MYTIKTVFDTKYNNICIHLEEPSKAEFINYAKKLDSWDNLYVSQTNGEVFTLRNYLRNYLLNYIEQ